MRLAHLSLAHYRNYHSLELDFHGSRTLLQGPNAQGKTNLLEAIFFLATSKPIHAQNEREIVDWAADEEPIPFCRVGAHIEDGGRSTELEIVLTPRGDGVNFTKQVKINGVTKRSMDLVGLMRAVLFLPEDISLVDGGPAVRRRYLDIALCQIDRAYCQALSAYQKVVTQRNSLLRSLREQGISPGSPVVEAQLDFWDERLVRHGAVVIVRRNSFLAALEEVARHHQAALSGGREHLSLVYAPSFNPGHLTDEHFEQLRTGQWADIELLPLDEAVVVEHYRRKLLTRRAREIASGGTLYGPHRDDFRFLADGHDLRVFGSRGQQRSAALALKLAEVHAMTEMTGAAPLLLLDDVMSELDAQRRALLLETLDGVEQAIITTTDWDDFAAEFRKQAQQLQVQVGAVEPFGEYQ